MWTRYGPCAPSTMVCSMSPVRDGSRDQVDRSRRHCRARRGSARTRLPCRRRCGSPRRPRYAYRAAASVAVGVSRAGQRTPAFRSPRSRRKYPVMPRRSSPSVGRGSIDRPALVPVEIGEFRPAHAASERCAASASGSSSARDSAPRRPESRRDRRCVRPCFPCRWRACRKTCDQIGTDARARALGVRGDVALGVGQRRRDPSSPTCRAPCARARAPRRATSSRDVPPERRYAPFPPGGACLGAAPRHCVPPERRYAPFPPGGACLGAAPRHSSAVPRDERGDALDAFADHCRRRGVRKADVLAVARERVGRSGCRRALRRRPRSAGACAAPPNPRIRSCLHASVTLGHA